MTLTQMYGFSKAMRKRNKERFHAEASLQAAIHGAKIKPLEELEDDSDVSFDEKTDRFLEEQAMKRLMEGRARGG